MELTIIACVEVHMLGMSSWIDSKSKLEPSKDKGNENMVRPVPFQLKRF